MSLIRRLLAWPRRPDDPPRSTFPDYGPVDLDVVAFTGQVNIYGVILADDGRPEQDWRAAIAEWAERANVLIDPATMFVKHRPDNRVRLAVQGQALGGPADAPS